MAYVDANGVVHGTDNSYSVVMGRVLTSLSGWLRLLIPLAVGIILFFLIRYFVKKYDLSKWWLITYIVLAVIIYLFWVWLLVNKFYISV